MKNFGLLVSFSILYVLVIIVFEASRVSAEPASTNVGQAGRLEPTVCEECHEEDEQAQETESNITTASNTKNVTKNGTSSIPTPTLQHIIFGFSPTELNATVYKLVNASDKVGHKQQHLPRAASTDPAPDNSSSPWSNLLKVEDPVLRSQMQSWYGMMTGNPECTKKTVCFLGNSMQGIPGRDFIFMILSRYVPQDWSLLYDIFRVSVMYGQNCEAYICILQQQKSNGLPQQQQQQQQMQFQDPTLTNEIPNRPRSI